MSFFLLAFVYSLSGSTSSNSTSENLLVRGYHSLNRFASSAGIVAFKQLCVRPPKQLKVLAELRPLLEA